jgi:hypothetical protein
VLVRAPRPRQSFLPLPGAYKTYSSFRPQSSGSLPSTREADPGAFSCGSGVRSVWAVITPRVRAGPFLTRGSFDAGGKPKNKRNYGAHHARPARPHAGRQRPGENVSAWRQPVHHTSSQWLTSFGARLHYSRPAASGSGVYRKWAGSGGCARRRWRRCLATASHPRTGAEAGVQPSAAESRSGLERSRLRRAPSSRHGPEHAILAFPQSGHRRV